MESLRAREVTFEEIGLELHPEAVMGFEELIEGKWHTPNFEIAGRVFHASSFRPEKPKAELDLPEIPSYVTVLPFRPRPGLQRR